VKSDGKVIFELGPNEVKVVKQIFQLAAEEMDEKKFARILNEQGFTKILLKKPSSFLAILSNQAYLGYRVLDKADTVGRRNPQDRWIIKKDCHPATINEELWNSAHNLLKRRKQK
jgi:site-specific DNA recombinase